MPSQQQISDEALELIHSLIASVDKCIIDDIRAHPKLREPLLAELDVLEKLKERLIVRLAHTD